VPGGIRSLVPSAALREAATPPWTPLGIEREAVQGVVDLDRHTWPDARHQGDVVGGGAEQALHRAEVAHEGLLADLADAGQLVEKAGRHPGRPLGSLVPDSEPVGLVADPLQQVEGLGPPRDDAGFGLARLVDLFEPLRQRHDRDAGQAEVLQDFDRPVELALAAVDDHQPGAVREPARPGQFLPQGDPDLFLADLVQVALEAPADHLAH